MTYAMLIRTIERPETMKGRASYTTTWELHSYTDWNRSVRVEEINPMRRGAFDQEQKSLIEVLSEIEEDTGFVMVGQDGPNQFILRKIGQSI